MKLWAKKKQGALGISSPLEGGAKWLRKNIPKLWIYESHICELRGEELQAPRLGGFGGGPLGGLITNNLTGLKHVSHV